MTTWIIMKGETPQKKISDPAAAIAKLHWSGVIFQVNDDDDCIIVHDCSKFLDDLLLKHKRFDWIRERVDSLREFCSNKSRDSLVPTNPT